ncbi:3-deoxy-7-phosphoheptulonate synthase class II [Sorangium sp. So ce321]|uniref:3-deoxy-7-phosphoheptulonate synthase class II n=1 Tax=Sorangium sp. So ce321 TaxID=3133300 RepID=UPI003F5DE38D
MLDRWSPDGWRRRPSQQIPAYPDRAALEAAEAQLGALPSLVLPGDVRRLKAEIAKVAEGRALLLQGGDCAESFAEFSAEHILGTSRVLRRMALLLSEGAGLPVMTVGRIAGQFAKPRSTPWEVVDGVELPSYRGDMINAPEFTAEARAPDPVRLLRAYHQSAATLDLLRALRRIDGCAAEHRAQQPCATELFTSHEALLLHYEQALTRRDETTGGWYDGSAHMVWLGDRTRQVDGAHVDFLRGISNPLGVKVGPATAPDDLLALIERLNPRNEPGRITVISRMGAELVEAQLPPLLRAVQRNGKVVVWACDPMHGNTIKVGRYKTRHFESILSEALRFFGVHEAEGTHAGGVHVEMTGKYLTECLGGAQAVTAASLGERYHTACDPRLSAHQSLELAALLSASLGRARRRGAPLSRRALST